MRAVDRAGVHVEESHAAELGQEGFVEAGPHPASVQSRSRRQQVTPLQPIRSAGTSAQGHALAQHVHDAG
ncbi:hypothetical protein [Streptomyces sp. 4N124]|uniref:hypothetical protein n=1 Tax=Streptomyces sp. 4N124 TaxID=3457420 RepID=UPI003FD22142